LIGSGEVGGVRFVDDFDITPQTEPTTEGNWGNYKAFSSTGGTLKPATPVRGGIITLGSDGDDEGASLSTSSPAFQLNNAEGKFWMEARVKVDTIAVTKYDAFIGLGEKMTLTATVPITATAGAMADKNLCGFLRPGTGTAGDGSLLRWMYKADSVTAVTIVDTAAQFVADTFIKLGMKFNPVDGYLVAYVNGVPLTTKKLLPASSGTDFPADVLMGPLAAVVNTVGSITSVFTIDWWRFAQLDAAQ